MNKSVIIKRYVSNSNVNKRFVCLIHGGGGGVQTFHTHGDGIKTLLTLKFRNIDMMVILMLFMILVIIMMIRKENVNKLVTALSKERKPLVRLADP